MAKKRNTRSNKNNVKNMGVKASETLAEKTEEVLTLDNDTEETVIDETVAEETVVEETVIEEASLDDEHYVDEAAESLDAKYSEGIEAYDDTLQFTDDAGDNKVVFDSITNSGDEGEEYGFDTKKDKKNKKNKKQKTDDKESFADFIKETFSKINNHIKNNKRIYSIAGALFVLILVIVIITIIVGNIKKSNNEKAKEVNSVGVSESNISDVSNEPLEENAYPEINELFKNYFAYIQNNDIDSLSKIRDYIDNVEKAKIEIKAKYIESYSNINCYTKKGPIENSFVCFVSYDVKVKDYDVVAPSLLAFLVCMNDNGEYYIYCNEFSQEMTDYTNKIVEQSDVHDLITRVNTQYNDILAANPEYSEYMHALNQIIKNEVGELLASQVYTDETVSENTVSDNTVSENEVNENDNNKVTVLEVKTTSTVNVRASDSEQADKLGKVTEGTVLTCNKQMDNGWSQIIYEGKVAYIKSEFLEVIGNSTDENLAVATDTVTVKETVKIRKKPSTDAESLGVAYAGETFPSVEKMNNGWTKIIYDNKEAYIKTEFLTK